MDVFSVGFLERNFGNATFHTGDRADDVFSSQRAKLQRIPSDISILL
jgi:hypothetical protein